MARWVSLKLLRARIHHSRALSTGALARHDKPQPVIESHVDNRPTATSSAGPLGIYEALLEARSLEPDPAQAHAAGRLQGLYEQLLTDTSASASGLKSWLRRLRKSNPVRGPKGLYLWGGVGRGKTTFMDIFYECLPFEHKFRTHFHRFMHEVHQDLAKFRGQQDPLALVADKLSAKARVFCFDEFEVMDIGDAMILAGLLTALFERGATLIATSNTPPDRLYENGLQRARFLPAIALIQQHTDVVLLDGGHDYRPRRVERAAVYHVPCNAESNQAMLDQLRDVSVDEPRFGEMLQIQGREIPTIAVSSEAVWFEFRHLCDAPRGKGDYVELAHRFHTVMISDIPLLHAHPDQLKRLISLVDEFYDRGVKLVVSAAAPPQALYKGKRLNREYARTASRLIEMQSQHYLDRPYQPGGQNPQRPASVAWLHRTESLS